MRSTITVLACGVLLAATGTLLQLGAVEMTGSPVQGSDGKTYFIEDPARQKEVEHVSEGVGLLGMGLILIGAFRWTRPPDSSR